MTLKLLVHQWGQVEAWIVMLVATWWIKDILVYDWKPTLCDRIKAGCDV